MTFWKAKSLKPGDAVIVKDKRSRCTLTVVSKIVENSEVDYYRNAGHVHITCNDGKLYHHTELMRA